MLRPMLAFFGGAVSVAGFAPLHLFPLPILALALLFELWSRCTTPRQAFMVGLMYGLGLFGAGVSWVYVSLHVFGHMPVLLAAFCVLLFVTYLALFPALVGFAQSRLDVSDVTRMLVLVPGLWLLGEWLRSWLFSGFPWLSIGYSQTGAPLSGLAPIAGVYGVGLAAAVTAGALFLLARGRSRQRVAASLVLLLVWVGGWAGSRIDWVQPYGEPMRVALVQGNIPLPSKWDPDQRRGILQRYWRLSEDRSEDLVVWPEAALPFFRHELPDTFWERLRKHPSDFVIGMLERRPSGDRVALYNSVVAVSNEGQGWYRKQHLVPFGEYLPLAALLGGLIKYLHIPMSDFDAWSQRQAPLAAAGVRLGISICYEDAFPEELIGALPAAQVLLNVSEDAWFGNSLAPHQRLEMAQMRSIETGRPMLRAANTGISALIDSRGVIQARAGHFKTEVLSGTVQPTSGATPYVRFGNVPAVVLGLLMLGVALFRRRASGGG